ncbi:MAG TPA: hypothetical protein VN457_02330 [Chlamydiales bacterium]|nr:hypothetical protein [Chlamydiales bacterium]
MDSGKLAKWLLRFGLAFVFMYATVEIHVNPDNFVKYIPNFVFNIVPLEIFLLVFGVAEVVLALWLLSGWKGQIPSVLAVLMIAGITLFNMDYFQILFRNVAIVFGGMALVVLELVKDKKRTT